jgi:hypothetical protein
MHRKRTLKTQLIVHVDFGFWFVELLEFFGAFLHISQFSIKDGLSSTEIKLPQCYEQNILIRSNIDF